MGIIETVTKCICVAYPILQGAGVKFIENIIKMARQIVECAVCTIGQIFQPQQNDEDFHYSV
jgi:hypothetical protein